MNKDILKEYFSKIEQTNTNPREDFQRELLFKLHERISRIERRRRVCAILLKILSAIAAICCVGYFFPTEIIPTEIVPTEIISVESWSVSPKYLALSFALFTLIFTASYLLYTHELRALREKLKTLNQ